MSEPKFQPGDRVRALRSMGTLVYGGVVGGHVYTVRFNDEDGDPVLPHEPEGEFNGWPTSLFDAEPAAPTDDPAPPPTQDDGARDLRERCVCHAIAAGAQGWEVIPDAERIAEFIGGGAS